MNAWFARTFPRSTRRFGQPVLAGPLPNHDALAYALHEGPARVVFCGDEARFYFRDREIDAYRPVVPEERLLALLRALVRMGLASLGRLDAARVSALWTDAELRVVVERARALLTITPDFFTGANGQRRVVGTRVVEPHEAASASRFASENVERRERAVLTSTEAYQGYWRFCKSTGAPPLRRTAFKTAFTDESLNRWGIGMRHDLRVMDAAGGRERVCQGWMGLALLGGDGPN